MNRITGKFVRASQIIKTFKNWPMVFLRLFGCFAKGPLAIGTHMVCTLRQGVKFKVRTEAKDDAIGTILGVWAQENHSHSRASIKDSGVVIDIGAHIGTFSVMAATLSRKAKIYAYEPHPENFGLLRDNILLNGLEERISPVNSAVVGQGGAGKRALHIGNVTSTHSFYFSSGDNRMTVACLTLPDIFQSNGIKQCDFLKIDCEGAEYEILFNTPPEYMDRIGTIHVEFHEGAGIDHNRQELWDFLKRSGFEVMLKAWHPNFGYIYGTKPARASGAASKV